MVYTPDELYQWGMEEGLGERMILCKNYNLHKFSSFPLDGMLIYDEETKEYLYNIAMPDGTTENVPFEQAKEFPPEVMTFLMDHPEQLLGELITFGEDMRIVFAIGETDDLRLINLNKTIILHMLDLLKINTKGKFKVMMEEATILRNAEEERAFVQEGIKEALEQ